MTAAREMLRQAVMRPRANIKFRIRFVFRLIRTSHSSTCGMIAVARSQTQARTNCVLY